MNKRMILLSALLLLAGFCWLTACKKTAAPAACISALPDSAFVGQRISFRSCTAGALNWYWAFGDGAYATTDSATHIYTQPGTYHGSLSASNGTGNTLPFTIVVSRPLNLWTFRGITDSSYYALTSGGDTLETSTFSAAHPSSYSNLIFVFSSLPRSAGQYQVVNDAFSVPGPMQVAIYLSTADGRYYGSTGNDLASVQVRVNAGMVSASLPAAMMVNLDNPTDSSSLSAVLTQSE